MAGVANVGNVGGDEEPVGQQDIRCPDASSKTK